MPARAGWVRPVNDVSFSLAEGETLGIVGESGSGKTILSLALMGLEPHGARRKGEVVAAVGEQRHAAHRHPPRVAKFASQSPRTTKCARSAAADIAMIFQEPMTALDPVIRIGAQIEEAIRVHEPALGRQRNPPPRHRFPRPRLRPGTRAAARANIRISFRAACGSA